MEILGRFEGKHFLGDDGCGGGRARERRGLAIVATGRSGSGRET